MLFGRVQVSSTLQNDHHLRHWLMPNICSAEVRAGDGGIGSPPTLPEVLPSIGSEKNSERQRELLANAKDSSTKFREISKCIKILNPYLELLKVLKVTLTFPRRLQNHVDKKLNMKSEQRHKFAFSIRIHIACANEQTAF